MAKTSNIVTEWGQAANTSNSGYGAGANNTIGWGSVHANSNGHDRTDLVGVPSVYVGNGETVDGSGDPTGGTAQLFYRNRIEARPLWNTRQNLLTYSEDFSNADWGKTSAGSGSAPIITLGQTDPNGDTRAAKVVFETTGGGSDRSILQQLGLTVTSGLEYTGRFYIKAETGADVGKVLNTRIIGGSSYTDITLTSDWQEISLTETSADRFAIEARISEGGSSGVINTIIAFPQLNEGDTADEYVKTEANPYSFKGDETQLNDFSASNNGGQIYSGGALSFTTNDYTESVDVGNVRTVAMWINPDGASEKIIDLDGSTHISTSSGDLNVAGSVGSTNYVNGVASDTVGSGSYKMICVVLDSAVDADAVRLARQGGNYGDLDIAEVRLFEDALTASEALIIYNNPQERGVNGKTPKVDWDINELNGGTLFDRSGNGYNATINGATWVSGVKEGYQPALSGFNNYQTFDGSDDYVNYSTPPITDLSNFDITVKLNLPDTQTNYSIWNFGNTSNNTPVCNLETTGGNVRLFFRNDAATGGEVVSSALTENEINTVRVVKVGTAVEMFINGTSVDTGTATSGAITVDNFAIGALVRTGVSSYLLGIIDFVEVEGVGRWSNLGGWVDEIGSNDGTVNGSPVSARIAGAEFTSDTDVFDNAFAYNDYYKFDGTDDYVNIGSVGLDPDSFTLSGKFVWNGTNNSTIFGQGNTANATPYIQLRITSAGTLQFVFRNDAGTITVLNSTASVITAYSLTTFSLTKSGTDVSFTVNGASAGSGTSTSGTITLDTGGIGASVRTSASEFFTGIIDYVEVVGVGKWENLNGFADSIGSNDGTINGSPVQVRKEATSASGYTTDEFDNALLKTTGYIANALNFSGSYSGLYVDAGANVDTSAALSLATWIYIDNLQTVSQAIMGDRQTDAGILFFNDKSGSNVFFRFRNEDGGGTVTDVDTAANYSIDTWYFIAVTRSSDGSSANIYLGTKDSTPTNVTDGGANQDSGTPTQGTENMYLSNRSAGDLPNNGYLIYPLMYTEDISTANTDLAPIEQIWDATKSLIP